MGIISLSNPFHKYDHVCGEGFLVQTRRERRAYPSAVCKERATTSGPKRTAARRVALLFGSGFVAPRSQPHCGGCSLVAPRQNRKSTQQTWSYLWNGVLRFVSGAIIFKALAAAFLTIELASFSLALNAGTAGWAPGPIALSARTAR